VTLVPHQFIAEKINLQIGKRKLLQDVSLVCQSGQWLQITGANGVGKSTLLRLLAGISDADEGQIALILDGSPTSNRSHHLVYQGHLAGFKDQFTVQENLQLQLALDGSGYQVGADLDADVAAAIQKVGLQHRTNLAFGKLSAGQKRRCALARLVFASHRLATVKVCWILDEPVTALDTQGQEVLVQLLNKHLVSGGSAILATHQDLAALGLPPPLQLNLSKLVTQHTNKSDKEVERS
jgi:heme exporter protein A